MSLVDTQWLYTSLNNKDLKILDCSWYLPNLGKNGKEEYIKERIPDSIYFDIDEFSDIDCPYPHTLLSNEKFSLIAHFLFKCCNFSKRNSIYF